MAFAGHRFAVEVGVGDGFGDNTAVVGGVIESDYIIQSFRSGCFEKFGRYLFFL